MEQKYSAIFHAKVLDWSFLCQFSSADHYVRLSDLFADRQLSFKLSFDTSFISVDKKLVEEIEFENFT